MAAKNDFQFNFRYTFTNEIENNLYSVDSRGLDNIPYHSIQQVNKKNARCLICNQKFSLPLDDETILQHFDTTTHENLDAFDTFITLFMSIPTFYEQLTQLFFKPKTPFTVFCEICNVDVEIYRLGIHMNLEKHQNEQVKRLLNSDWQALKLDILKTDAIYTQSYGVANYLFVTKWGKSAFYCYLCNCFYENTSQIAHWSKKHTGELSKESIKKVYEYNTFFLCCDSRMKALKKYFVPGRQATFQCILCRKEFDSFNLIFHVGEFPCVFLNDTHPFYDSSIDYEKSKVEYLQSLPFCNYDETVNLKLYPKSVVEDIYRLENIPPYTVQNRDGSLVCLLCKGIVILHGIEHHLNTKPHNVKSCEKKTLQELVTYHTFWMALGKDFQLYQSIFFPFNDLLKCSICKDRIPYNIAIEHYENHNKLKESSVERSISLEASGSSTPLTSGHSSQVSGRQTPRSLSYKLSKLSINKSNDSLATQIADALVNKADEISMPQSDKRENVSISSQIIPNRNLDCSSNGLCDVCQFPTSKSTNQKSHDYTEDEEDDQTSFHSAELQSSNGFGDKASNIEENSGILLKYCEETENKLYSSFNRERGERRPTMFFMQKRSLNYFCLFCNTYVTIYVIDHIATKKHIKNSQNENLISAVKVYHDYWMKQSPEEQLEQINYNPESSKRVTCVMCNNTFRYGSIKKHSCPLKRLIVQEGVTGNTDYTSVLGRYNSFTIKKFFAKTFMDISKRLFKFDMPLGVQWAGLIVCYFCGKKVTRDNALWLQHLQTKHLDAVWNCSQLEIIKSFHEFWIKQPLDQQVLLVNFRPKTKTDLTCIKGHVVKFSRAVDHSSNCAIPDMHKILRSLERSVSENDESLVEDQLASTSRQDENATGKSIIAPGFEPLISPNDFPSAFNGKPPKSKTNGKNSDSNNTLNLTLDPESHEVEPSTSKVKNGHLIDKIPKRYENELEFLEKISTFVKCMACNTELKEEFILLTHISTKNHISKTNNSEIKWSYLCEICDHKCKTEELWQAHLYGKDHAQCLSNLLSSRLPRVQEHECDECKLVIFGDNLSIIRHKQALKPKNSNQRNANNKFTNITLCKSVKDLFASAADTERTAQAMAYESDCAYEDSKDLMACTLALEQTLSTEFPGCKGYPFGSRFSAIGNKKSDLDIFMDTGNMYSGTQKQDGLEQQQIVLKVKDLLQANQKEFDQIYPITKARTPIVRVIHVPTDIDCDLSFRNGLSVENTKYIAFCFDVQPSARLGMLLLRKWAEMLSLKEEITSYALCMMYMFHLQLQGYLLSVNELRKISGLNVQKIDGWETINFNELELENIEPHIKIFQGDVHELLREFFNFYSKFDFVHEIVCPLLGRTISKLKFEERKFGAALPTEMDTYKRKVQKDPDVQFRANCPMCVQDPFDLGHNLSKSVPKKFKEYFQHLCLLSFEHLRNNP